MGICAFAAALVAPDALAEDGVSTTTERSAQELRTEADRLYMKGKYAEARAILERGYALTGDPAFIFNRAVTYHSQGDCEQARASYRRYLQMAPDGAKRSLALEALTFLDPVCGETKRTEVGPPLPTDEPGLLPHARPDVPAPVRDEAARPDRGGFDHVLPWSLLGASAAALTLSGVFAALWYDASGDYDSLVRSAAGTNWDDCCAPRGAALRSSQRRDRALVVGFAAGGLLLAGTGMTLFLLSPVGLRPGSSASFSFAGRF